MYGDHLGAGDRAGGAGAERATHRTGVPLFTAGDRAGEAVLESECQAWKWWRSRVFAGDNSSMIGKLVRRILARDAVRV